MASEREAILHELSEDQVRERARVIWEREGRPHGRNEEHWRRAQEELRDELQANFDRRVPDSEKVPVDENPLSQVVAKGGDAPVTPDVLKRTGRARNQSS
jgi:hypothetical protein